MYSLITQPPSLVRAYYNSPHLGPAFADPSRKHHSMVHPIFIPAYVQYR